MHKSRLAALVLDSQVDDIEQANHFWQEALGLKCVRSEQAWAAQYSHLETPENQPDILIQKVTHESRVHLDIETDNIAAEVARLSQLGAKVIKVFERWTVMQAPTGHNFCVVNPQRSDFDSDENVNQWHSD